MKIIHTLLLGFAMTTIVTRATPTSAGNIGRPVRILSLSFKGESLDVISKIIEREATQGVDLIVLPETWRGQNNKSMEPLDGPTTKAMSVLAKKYNTYIVSPIDQEDTGQRMNSAVLLDRRGRVVFVYHKVFPYWSEFNLKPKVNVGQAAPVYKADFGRIGIATCFDVNFPEVWRSLADQGAELVLWPSAYSAGTTLQAHALNNHYYIVTATGTRDSQVYDITGERILDQTSKGVNVAHVTLDLDRGIYHENFNLAKRDKLLKEHRGEVEVEKALPREQWFVLRAVRPGVSARALAHQYGLEELRDYVDRSRRDIDAMRGWSFAEKVDERGQP
ncbi:MAG: carbon-nitrogen hydrolase family protein [Acidobacteriaceae bacterium]|nr:carbon-nitrogen hydrolase family protein [Acidobacteriaceae bacterium]